MPLPALPADNDASAENGEPPSSRPARLLARFARALLLALLCLVAWEHAEPDAPLFSHPLDHLRQLSAADGEVWSSPVPAPDPLWGPPPLSAGLLLPLWTAAPMSSGPLRERRVWVSLGRRLSWLCRRQLAGG